MLAASYERTGPARDVLQVGELPDLQPGPGEVRVRVRISGVNPSDWRLRSGVAGVPMQFARQTPGQDGAGEIDSVGTGVDPQRIGQRVWIYHAALRRAQGSAGQHVVVPAEQAVELPDHVTLEQGAGLGIPFMTAHRCLLSDGPLDGQTVLVAGGAGAVGNAAIQLAKRAGARVVTTVSTARKAEIAAAAGADRIVVDYRRPAAADEIRAFAPDGVHRVIEVALATNLALDLKVLSPGGAIVTYATEPSQPTLPVLPLMFANAVLRFVLIYTVPPAALRHAKQDIDAALRGAGLHALPGMRLPLADIVAAHEAVERGVTGKMLLDIP
jgi:NADPH:quinone reductase